MTAPQRLQLGLLVGADHILVIAQLTASPVPVVQVEHPGGLVLKVRVAGKDPGPVLPRLHRVRSQPAAHRRGRDHLDQSTSRDLGRQVRAGPPRQRNVEAAGGLQVL
jgi:hypothetical protein